MALEAQRAGHRMIDVWDFATAPSSLPPVRTGPAIKAVERHLLARIARYVQTWGYAPSTYELVEREVSGLKSTSEVNYHLHRCGRRGT